jgi:hypothetical protein
MAPTPRLAVGVSSLVTHAEKDIDLGVPDIRQAHGLYVRASPFRALVLLGEADVVANTASPTDADSSLAPLGRDGPARKGSRLNEGRRKEASPWSRHRGSKCTGWR